MKISNDIVKIKLNRELSLPEKYVLSTKLSQMSKGMGKAIVFDGFSK